MYSFPLEPRFTSSKNIAVACFSRIAQLGIIHNTIELKEYPRRFQATILKRLFFFLSKSRSKAQYRIISYLYVLNILIQRIYININNLHGSARITISTNKSMSPPLFLHISRGKGRRILADGKDDFFVGKGRKEVGKEEDEGRREH